MTSSEKKIAKKSRTIKILITLLIISIAINCVLVHYIVNGNKETQG